MAKKRQQLVETPVHKRSYLKQSDVPTATLEEALRVPQAILDHYGGQPTSPFHVAKALSVDPKGSQFRLISGAAIAFGLIDGGAQASTISVTELARRILRPKVEHGDLLARREAILLPRVFGEFLRKYDGHPFPRSDIAQNILEEMGVPRDKARAVLDRMESCARSVGFMAEIRDKVYVSLQDATTVSHSTDELDGERPSLVPDVLPQANTSAAASTDSQPFVSKARQGGTELAAAIADDFRRGRVFITHGTNRELVEPIKKLLEYGELEAVVSIDRQSVSKPVPEKVMDDMRGCGAAIIHVDVEKTIIDRDEKTHVLLNPNVLIEIGAAMAFYGRRFILLVREGVKLPSNLQGLYEVRYSGNTLDAGATIRLLEAIKDIKNYALPTASE